MKYLLTLVTLLFIGFSSIELYAQGPNYLSGLKPIQFDDIKGMEITITDLKDENRTFYYEVPDTLWIKESKEPRLNKHYKIIHIYKGIESENGLGYYTPADAIIGRTFLVEDITYSKNEPDIEIPSNSRSNIFTCRLKDTTTGEIIYMKIEDKNLNSSLKFKARDITLCNDIIGKKYVRKLSTTGTPVEIKDCFYNFNSLWSEKTIELKTMGGTIIYQNQLEAYTTIEVYKLKQERIQQEKKWKQIEEMANDGNYKICVSSVQKPSSSRFTKGELSMTEDGMVYTDNHTSLIIIPQEDRFYISITNKSQNNIEIEWDKIIYINESNHSGRVIHSGIKYADKNNPQTPSLVAPTTSITDVIIPADNIYLSSVSYEWRILSLLKNGKTNGSYDGKNVKINLPIKINGVSYEYVIVYDLIWKWKNPEARKIWLEHINTK